MKIVVKIGGSVSISKSGPRHVYFSGLLPVLQTIRRQNQLIVVIGGGQLTRSYGRSIEKFHLKDEEKESIFIELISANVRFMAATLKTKPIFSLDHVKPSTSGVIGGIAPGRSTDANAAMAAKKIKADLFIKITDVNGIYDKDPKRFKSAKKLDSLAYSDMKKLTVKGRPNKYGVLDKTAVQVLSSSKIRTVVINGKDPKNILKALNGEKIGTVIE